GRPGTSRNRPLDLSGRSSLASTSRTGSRSSADSDRPHEPLPPRGGVVSPMALPNGPRVKNGAFQLPGEYCAVNPSQQELLEVLSFRQRRHDDLLDAAAFGCAYLLDAPEPCIFG